MQHPYLTHASVCTDALLLLSRLVHADAPGAVLTGEDEAAVPMIQRDVDDRWGVAFDLRSVGVNAFSRFVGITVRLSSQGSQQTQSK